MSSETVTVYIAGVFPGHKSFDAPIVASAQARRTAKQLIIVDGDADFHMLAGWATHVPIAQNRLSMTRIEAVKKYLARCDMKVDIAAATLERAQQAMRAAIALLDFEKANPQ